MAVRLVQEIVEELGAEVMVNTPLPMRDSAQAGLGFVVVDNGEGEVVRRIELCGLYPEAWHTSENAQEKVADVAPMLVIAVGQSAAEALGFHHPIAQLSTRTAIYWQDAHSRRGCFVLFLPEPDAVNKSAWLSQIYKAERYLSGEQSPWDEIGRGPCMGTRMAPTNHYPYENGKWDAATTWHGWTNGDCRGARAIRCCPRSRRPRHGDGNGCGDDHYPNPGRCHLWLPSADRLSGTHL